MSADCPFCALPPERIVADHGPVIVLEDAFPVSPGHSLVVPRRHIPALWDATPEERAALWAALDARRAHLDRTLAPPPEGYNVGVNVGRAAGQTVMHLHVHLIPRWPGDVPDPRGGVRHVIPDKGSYLAPRAGRER